LVGLLVGADVTDGLRVEDHDIGIHPLLEPALLLHLRDEAFRLLLLVLSAMIPNLPVYT
jgi:hypothetical protein